MLTRPDICKAKANTKGFQTKAETKLLQTKTETKAASNWPRYWTPSLEPNIPVCKVVKLLLTVVHYGTEMFTVHEVCSNTKCDAFACRLKKVETDNKSGAKRQKTESSVHTLDRYFKKPT